jgi:hypothetical protein
MQSYYDHFRFYIVKVESERSNFPLRCWIRCWICRSLDEIRANASV